MNQFSIKTSTLLSESLRSHCTCRSSLVMLHWTNSWRCTLKRWCDSVSTDFYKQQFFFFWTTFKSKKDQHVAACSARASAILNSSSRSSAAPCWSSSLGRVALRWPPACSSTLPSLTTTDTSPFPLAELRRGEGGEHRTADWLTHWKQSNKTSRCSARCWLTSVWAVNPLWTWR